MVLPQLLYIMTEDKVNTMTVNGVLGIDDGVMPIYHLPDFEKRLKTLTFKERLYFSIMRSQYGVLFLTSMPGIAKSAITRTIAHKMGLQYIDIRLSMADETDMQFPSLVTREFANKVKITVIEHAVPEWAVMSNDRPTLIHFEELNRSSEAVRNAALQILLERGIGYKFNFNKNVYMVSSGNLGLDDGTEVHEFDNATANRLIHLEHDLTTPEWLEWGQGIIHPDILSFIDVYKDKIHVNPSTKSRAYATARSWTMLSELLIHNFGGGAKVREVLDENGEVVMVHPKENSIDQRIKPKLELIRSEDGRILKFPDGYDINADTNLQSEPLHRNWGNFKDYEEFLNYIGSGVVGSAASESFIRFLNNRNHINLTHIINDYPSVRTELHENFNRDKKSEILAQARKAPVYQWTVSQVDNFGAFLLDIAPEERVGYFMFLIDFVNEKYKDGIETQQVRRLLTKFQDDLIEIRKLNNDNQVDD